MEINLSNLLGADLNSAISLNNLGEQDFSVGDQVYFIKVNPVNLSMRDPRNFPESYKSWSEEFMSLVTYEVNKTEIIGISDISECQVEGKCNDKPDKIIYLPVGAYLVHNSGRLCDSGKIINNIYITNKYPYKELKWIIKMDNYDKLVELMKNDILTKQFYFSEKESRLTQEELLHMRFNKVNLNINWDNVKSDCQLPLRYWNMERIPIKLGKIDERVFSHNSVRVLALPLDPDMEEFYMNIRYDGMVNVYTDISDGLKPKKKLSTGYITRYEEVE